MCSGFHVSRIHPIHLFSDHFCLSLQIKNGCILLGHSFFYFFIHNRKRVPPKSLLKLVKHYDLGQSEILMKRCQSLCLFNKAKSWALTSTYNRISNTFEILPEDALNDSISTLVPDEYPLAKAATGTSTTIDNGGSPSRRAIRKITNMIQNSLGLSSTMIPSR